MFGLALVGKVLARAEVGRNLLLNHSVLRQLTQLLLGIRVPDRVVVLVGLINFLYLPRIVFDVLEYLVRVL